MHTRQQLEGDHSQRPHIDRHPIGPSEALRSPVGQSPAFRPQLQLLMTVANHARQLEIDQLEGLALGVVQDVLGLDIAMADSLLAQVVQAVQEQRENFRGLVLFQGLFLPHVLAEVGVFEELDDQVAGQALLVHEEVLALDDGLVVELHEDLVVDSHVLEQLEVPFLADFDSVGLACGLLNAFVDYRLGTFAYLLANIKKLFKTSHNRLIL